MMRQRRRMMMLSGGGGANTSYTYTGTSVDHGIVTMSAGSYRLIELASSGDLAFAKSVTADIWMCNGGNGGGKGSANIDTGKAWAGNGGGGGYHTEIDSSKVQSATVVIGAGGASNTLGGQSSITISGTSTAPTAQSAIKDGASGGGCEYNTDPAGYGDGLNCYPFADSTYFLLHCSGGGGGASFDTYRGTRSGGAGGENGANGSAGTTSTNVGGTGGSGAGNGGLYNSNTAESATRYGCGGGGGGARGSTGTQYAGGSGYQGIVYIRIAAQGEGT